MKENRKQEIGNEASGFYPLSPGPNEKHAFTDSRLSRKALSHFFQPPVEEGNKAKPEGFAIH